MEVCDIVMTTWQRKDLTEKTLSFLHNRTKYPYRLFVVDNHSTDGTLEVLERFKKLGIVFLYVSLDRNVGIHMVKNIGLSLVESELYVDTDNDVYVPEVQPDWLSRQIDVMERNPEFGAVAIMPHVFLGRSDPEISEADKIKGVVEVGHCGGVWRIMRTKAVRDTGGWARTFNAKRNNEELHICSRLQTLGFKTGYNSTLRAYHEFGMDNNWGYGEDMHPHDHGHRIPGGSKWATDPEKAGEIWPTPMKFKEQESQFDEKLWTKKI